MTSGYNVFLLVNFLEFYFSSYDPKFMIEMDQFVINLSGQLSVQTVERLSGESVATMKEVGSTISRYVSFFRFLQSTLSLVLVQ